jgi:hypothetical protein
MNTNPSKYDEARKAAVKGNDPMAYLRLGIIYFYGNHTERNIALARYFIGKAVAMSSGKPEQTALIRKYLQEECNRGNYGLLSVTNKYLSKLYPSYRRKKAIDDFLADKDTFAAKTLYSQCTSDNTAEVLVSQQESLLRQLYSEIIADDNFRRTIPTDALDYDTEELTLCLNHFTNSYKKICAKYPIDKQDLLHLEAINLFPYISTTTLYQLRRQAFKCLLSIRHLEPVITKKYLTHLDDDKYLLDICPNVLDFEIAYLLISFVELNVDIETIELSYLRLLRSYQNNNIEPLISHINGFIGRLNNAGVSHPFHLYSKETLPTIIL